MPDCFVSGTGNSYYLFQSTSRIYGVYMNKSFVSSIDFKKKYFSFPKGWLLFELTLLNISFSNEWITTHYTNYLFPFMIKLITHSFIII